MKQQQEWLSRMEQAQLEFLARASLESMERERRRQQRDLEARREIPTLTDRLLEFENVWLEAQRRADDFEERTSLVSDSKRRYRDLTSELETLKINVCKRRLLTAGDSRRPSPNAHAWQTR
ncbi:hypothetical protein V7S43_018804 [Phytophthora oleae]|uniref:Uncharacterized protein n=1 Tax=Phytophthora oleae TaxID=2107226 RepID=A0ABD3EQD3_9STRA